ncbi:MAG: hypothetical protein MUE51_13415, partial [Thermoleophilia bacterium]|nr:hypothetical protein [Thermoleophilia bacterium]
PQNAYAALNRLAVAQGLIPVGAIRDVWASENAPQPQDLTRLTAGLPGVAGCSAAAGSPPQVASCTPPAGSSGFTAAQWTAVVNRMLAEADAAGEVLAYFTDLKTLRDGLFLQENAELPSIGSDLGLQAAAANTAPFNPLGLMAGSLGIAASIAGLIPEVGAELSAALWVASEATSMIPQTSPTATSSELPSTYAGLQARFATMVSETEKGLAVMSQQVRQDSSLLGLVSQLRASGPWASSNLDTIGMQSAANQAFAIWVYQALMPTVFDRYGITQCAVYGNALCYGPASGTPGVIGGSTSPNNETPFNFIMIGPQRDLDGGVPCYSDDQDVDADCTFTPPSATLMNSVWGAPTAACSYVPGKAATAWTFGCNAGVDPTTTIGQNPWDFTTHVGAFDVSTSHCGAPFGNCAGFATAGATAQERTTARTAHGLVGTRPIVLARPRAGGRPAAPGRAAIRAAFGLPRDMRLAGATLRLDRVLVEPGSGELTAARDRRGRPPLRLRLAPAGAGRFVAATAGRTPVRVAVRVRPVRAGGLRASLTISGPVLRTPRACHALPAAVATAGAPLQLESRLVIGDGRRGVRVDLVHDVRCRRDARGTVSRLEYVRTPARRTRSGPALAVRGPGVVTPGATARYVARVRNPRRDGARVVSSLWDVTLTAGGRTSRIRELRRGRTRTVALTLRVPRTARGRFCTVVTAAATGTRADRAQVCARVRPG